VKDTDGESGAEVIAEIKNLQGQLACICVIHDVRGSYASYIDPFWGTVSINGVIDIDDYPGSEILLTYRSNTDQGVGVIRDRGERPKSYGFVGRDPIIQQVGDYGGELGTGICVLLSNEKRYELISGKLESRTLVNDCAAHN
jgi:hypothetical protein